MRLSNKTGKIYFILIFIYALSDMLTSPNVGFIGSNRIVVYLLLVTINIYMIIKLIKIKKLKYNVLIVSMLLYFIWQLIIQILHTNYSWTKFIELGLSFWWPLSILYILNSFQRKYTRDDLDRFVKTMFILYVFFNVYASYNISKNFAVDIARINISYYVIVFLPFILEFRSQKDKHIFILVTFIITLLSMKRGPIILFPLMILTYSFVTFIIKGHKFPIKKVFEFIIFIIMTVFLIILFDKVSDGFLLSRFSIEQLKYGSGREYIISDTIYNLKQRNVIQLLFGFKSHSEIVLTGGVHNEWLRVLYGQGLISVIFYGNVFIQLYRYGIKFIKNKSQYASGYWSLLVYVSVVTLIGGMYFSHSSLYLMIYIGLVLSRSDNFLKRNNYK